MDGLININWLLFCFISLSLAELSIQIVTSELSTWILGQLRLSMPYNQKLQTLSLSSFWRKLLGNWWIIVIPIILLTNIHKFFAKMFSCPYCLATWLAFFTNHFYLKMDIITAALLAPVCLAFVAILDKLHLYE